MTWKKWRGGAYLAYLVRLWREGEAGPWRALIEDPHTGEQQGFADLVTLFEFLSEQAQGRKAPDAGGKADMSEPLS